MSSLALALFLPVAALANVKIPTREIAPGVSMPVISIGTGGQERSAAYNITYNWLSQGGRGIDSAFMYKDQDVVAKAIADTGVSRKDLFITSKVPGCSDAAAYVEDDLKQLGTDYIDLMLIHFPSGPAEACADAWSILESYHSKGILRAIGISNFNRTTIEKLMETATVVPAINQIQLNIIDHDQDTIACSREHNITVEAYSPVGRSGHSGDISANPVIMDVAAKHKVDTYRVALKWILQHNHVLTFQSSSKAHQESDANVFNFELTDEDMAALDQVKPSEANIVV